MATSRDDPGRGDPTGIRQLVARREDTLLDLASATSLVSAVGEFVTPAVWDGGAKRAFSDGLLQVHGDLSLLVSGIEAHDEALRVYAAKLEAIQDVDAELTTKQARAEAERATATAGLVRLALGAPSEDGLGLVGDDAVTEAARRQARDVVEAAEAEIAALEARRDELVAERDAIDAECIASLTGADALGPLGRLTMTPTGGDVPSPGEVLATMATLTPTDVILLFASPTVDLDALFGLDPGVVRAWWDGLCSGELDANGLSARQAGLLAAAPTFFGALDGLPVLARVRANQIAAEQRVTALTRRIATLDPATQRTLIAAAESERAYLARAVSGEIQLYVYDKTKSRIIEMVGTLGPDTTDVVTYVPGTLASMDAFYSRQTQQVSRWLVDNSGGHTVAFVYKDGKFAGEGKEFYPDIAFLEEANSPGFTRRTGATLARFQEGLAVDPLMAGRQTTALGHSWGLSNVTASETAGAHYDKVASLAGAGMAPEWRPDPSTSYADFSYDDILMLAQSTGRVWDGNNPRAHEVFEHGDYYEGPKAASYVSDTPISSSGGVPKPWVLVPNHGLVAQDVEDNRDLLEDIRKWMND